MFEIFGSTAISDRGAVCHSQLLAKFMIARLETPLDSRSLLPDIEGSVQIFTGAERGFFTDVMAQALRVAGQGTKVLIVQFLKGSIDGGSDRPLRLGQHLDWLRCDLPRCIDSADASETEIASVRSLWEHVRQKILAGEYSLVVLDELSLAIEFGIISAEEVLEMLQSRLQHVDVILTGPQMPPALLAAADRITEIRRSDRI